MSSDSKEKIGSDKERSGRVKSLADDDSGSISDTDRRRSKKRRPVADSESASHSDVDLRRSRKKSRRSAEYDSDSDSDHRRSRRKRRKADKADRKRKSRKRRRRRDVSESSSSRGSSSGGEVVESASETGDKEINNAPLQKLTLDGTGRAGGVYIPPFKLKRMQVDTKSVQYQRQTWEALRKSLKGIVNRINANNFEQLIPDLFKENLIRGRGLFSREVMRSQMASPGYTHVFAALIAVVNSKLPEIGELTLKRIVLQFRRAYRLNDRIVCTACLKFVAHLINQRVAHELVGLQTVMLLLEAPTDNSTALCVEFLKECGVTLRGAAPSAFDLINTRLRAIMQNGEVEKRVQYVIEGYFVVVKNQFKDYPSIPEDLDLVDEDDRVTHEIQLDDPTVKGEEMLNIYKELDMEQFEDNEKKWAEISKTLLGGDSSSEDSEAASDDEAGDAAEDVDKNASLQIIDYTEQELVNLRKAIYLCIMSSAGFEECVHKLLKLNIRDGAENEVCTMIIDCCSMERTTQTFFALCAERLSRVKDNFRDCFMECFRLQYETAHRLETNKLRNIANLFTHLLYTDAMPWAVLQHIVLTEAETTSASRIFVKTVLLELSRNMGFEKLNRRMQDPSMQPYLQGLFPTDHPKNIRFAINFFTAIGLGGLSEKLRDTLTAIQAK